MKRAYISFFAILIFAFMSGFATADDFQPVPNSQDESSTLKKIPNSSGNALDKIHFQSGNSQSRFLLEFNKRSCLMQCDTQFETCLSSAGGSADAKFRCGEKRWACSRNCDAQTNKPFKF